MDAFYFKLLVDFPVSSAYSGCFDSHCLPFVCWTLLIVLIHFLPRDKCRKSYVFLLSVLKRMRRKPLLAHIILINMFV